VIECRRNEGEQALALHSIWEVVVDVLRWFPKNARLLKALFPRLVIYILGCVVLLFLLTNNAEYIDSLSHGHELRDAAVHGVVLVLIFYIFFHLVTTVSFLNHIENTFVSVLAADQSMFEHLSTSTKERYVTNSLQSTLGDTFGKAVVSDIISPYLRGRVPHRIQFEYNIEVLDDVPPFAGLNSERCKALIGKLTPENGYLWLNQTCRYIPVNPASSNPFKGPYIIAITFDKIELQRLMPKHLIYFREIIEMERGLKDIALRFTHADADEFIKKVLRLSISEIAGGQPAVSYDVEVKNSASASLYIQITAKELPPKGNSNGIIVSFNSPQSREAPWFVTSLPQPCFKPIISFRRNSQMTRLEPVFFLSNFQEEKVRAESRPPGSEDPVEFRVAVDGWTFPTNGIMFTWRYKRDAPGRDAATLAVTRQVRPETIDGVTEPPSLPAQKIE
jgi:hypothetical protein